MRRRVAVLISGTGSNMLRLIEDMDEPDHPGKPVLVLADRTEAAGLAKAAASGVPQAAVPFAGGKERFERALTEHLEAAGTEFICLAGFMRILSPAFVAAWPGRILNIHPSLLPAFRGLDTHARVLAAGAAVHGATVHEVTSDLDGGPILGQAVVEVMPDDTPESLAERVQAVEHRLYPAVLRRHLRGDRRPIALLP
ncbi:MAG: phosphoribosylglycinamide formyltransferase [Pseudomonadota bacterium]